MDRQEQEQQQEEQCTAVHHFAVRSVDGPGVCQRLTEGYGFEIVASRRAIDAEQQWALRRGKIFVLVSEAPPPVPPTAATAAAGSGTDTGGRAPGEGAEDDATADGVRFSYPTSVSAQFAGDTVYDVCLLVKSVQDSLDRFTDAAEVVLPARRVADEHGSVEYAVVKSCVGNVYHTLLNRGGYSGPFLPGFVAVVKAPRLSEPSPPPPPPLEYIDHLAFCVRQGETPAVLEWYEKRFGMKRFMMNRSETASGCDIDSIKLRMVAMDYWKCAETGLSMPGSGTGFVIGETLDPNVVNQITTFLAKHGGPGVQHFAFYTNDIMAATTELRRRGTKLIDPPPTYYQEPEKYKEILNLGMDPKKLESIGVLLDTEADAESRTNSYLLQVFTQPVFDTNNFFLEIIQRHGARGFGAGNVTALFLAVERFLSERNKLASNSVAGGGGCDAENSSGGGVGLMSPPGGSVAC